MILLLFVNVAKNGWSLHTLDMSQFNYCIKRDQPFRLYQFQKEEFEMSQQIKQYLMPTEKQVNTDQSCLDYSHFKDCISHQRLDYSTSTLNDQKHNSSHLDNLLYSSFVQLDQFVQRENQTFNLESGQSFFKRSNNILFTDFGKREEKKMCHKKVQCQIGKGSFSTQGQSFNTLISKFKTLEVLKMAKLIKLILKQLKQSVSSIKKQVQLNDQTNRQNIFYLQCMFQERMISVNQELSQKNNKIREFERQNQMLNQDVSKLKHDLDQQMEENMRYIKHIEDQKYKNTFEVNRLEDQKQQTIVQLTQKLDKFDITHSLLQEEINNLNEIIVEQQRQYKKLQYEKNLLQNEYNELSKRNEEWLKKSMQNQVSFNEDCIDFQKNNQEINQLIRLNNLYLKEIQSCKSEIQRTKEENILIRRQSENYVADQIAHLGQYYELKYKELQSECNKNIDEKQSSKNLVKVFKKKQPQSPNYKNNQKRNISSLTFRQAISSLKKDHEIQVNETQVTNSLTSQKQNKNNLNSGAIKQTKSLSQQLKEPLPFQNHQNMISTMSSSNYLEKSEEVVFKANQHFKGKINLSNLLYNDKKPSIPGNMKQFKKASKTQSIQAKQIKNKVSNYMKN